MCRCVPTYRFPLLFVDDLQLIQPFSERSAAVLRFLEAEAARQGKAGRIAFKCVPIVTAAPEQGSTDPTLDCLVLSEETLKGGALLNGARRANGIQPLEVRRGASRLTVLAIASK